MTRAARRTLADAAPGTVHGYWTVTGAAVRREDGQAELPVVCACGAESVVLFRLLGRGSRSCGCLRLESVQETFVQHGGAREGSRERLHKVWTGMKQRCNNPNRKEWPNYGGRGIAVCDEWAQDYAAFRQWALDNGYDDALDIDRVDNDGPYSPKNCRWVTRSQNLRNRRSNRLETAWNETKSVADWMDDPRCAVGKGTLATRLRLGWHLEDALTAPLHTRPYGRAGSPQGG